MKKTIKRAASALIFCCLLFIVSSCGVLTPPSETEVKEVLTQLLPRSYEATYIVYGPGIEIDENFEIDESWTISHYAPVASSYKYQTIEDVKSLIFAAFSADYGEEMCEYAFAGNETLMSRYSESGGKLTMDVTKKPLDMAEEIFIDSAKVVSGSAYACLVEIEYIVEGDTERSTMEVRLVKENGRWLFDGPTY